MGSLTGYPMPFGPVRACGPIPPCAARFARALVPPSHEDEGVYAARRAQGNLQYDSPGTIWAIFVPGPWLMKLAGHVFAAYRSRSLARTTHRARFPGFSCPMSSPTSLEGQRATIFWALPWCPENGCPVAAPLRIEGRRCLGVNCLSRRRAYIAPAPRSPSANCLTHNTFSFFL